MPSRRMFLGSAAGAGAGLAGYSLTQFAPAATAQPHVIDPVTRELHRQLRLGIPKLREADGAAARQVALTLRIYAATQAGAPGVLQQAIRSKGRAALLHAPVNHEEMERIAASFGFPPSFLPPHAAADPPARDRALHLLMDQGLDAFMREAADMLEALAPSWDARTAAVRNVARQCPNCDWACGLVPTAEQAMAIACAAAQVFPPAAEVCVAASATWLTVLGACMACQFAVGC